MRTRILVYTSVLVFSVSALLVECLQGNRALVPRSHPSERWSAARKVAARNPMRPVYPFSIVPGGVRSRDELRAAIQSDRLVALHYAAVDVDRLRPVTLQFSRAVYVSFRKDGKVYWTSRKVQLAKGERVLEGTAVGVRERCGNQISARPRKPVLADARNEPSGEILSTPEAAASLETEVAQAGHAAVTRVTQAAGREEVPPPPVPAPPPSPLVSGAAPGGGGVGGTGAGGGGTGAGTSAPPPANTPLTNSVETTEYRPETQVSFPSAPEITYLPAQPQTGVNLIGYGLPPSPAITLAGIPAGATQVESTHNASTHNTMASGLRALNTTQPIAGLPVAQTFPAPLAAPAITPARADNAPVATPVTHAVSVAPPASQVSEVPEPGTWLMLGSGIGLVWLCRKQLVA